MHWRFWERRIKCGVCERTFSERDWRRNGSPEDIADSAHIDIGFGCIEVQLSRIVCSDACVAVAAAERVMAEVER